MTPIPELYLYHVTNGRAYRAPDKATINEYKAILRQAYGSLRGVKLTWGRSKADALAAVARGQFC